MSEVRECNQFEHDFAVIIEAHRHEPFATAVCLICGQTRQVHPDGRLVITQRVGSIIDRVAGEI